MLTFNMIIRLSVVGPTLLILSACSFAGDRKAKSGEERGSDTANVEKKWVDPILGSWSFGDKCKNGAITFESSKSDDYVYDLMGSGLSCAVASGPINIAGSFSLPFVCEKYPPDLGKRGKLDFTIHSDRVSLTFEGSKHAKTITRGLIKCDGPSLPR